MIILKQYKKIIYLLMTISKSKMSQYFSANMYVYNSIVPQIIT